MKHYRLYSPNQSYLLPPSPMDWLPDGHLAYFVLEIVQTLDVGGIDVVRQAKDGRGTQPYDTRMMIALLVYGYCVGVFSSRRIERATHEDVPFRVLAGGQHPHFTTISDFRLEHREALAGLFAQVLQLCSKAGLVKLGHVSLDGTKILANASKHKAMSYKRMTEEEQRLAKQVDELLGKADAIDRAEDELYGVGQAPLDLPKELQHREVRLRRIREARAALEQEAAVARAAELRANAGGQEKRSQDTTQSSSERKRAATRAKKARQQAEQLWPEDKDDPPGGSVDLPRHRVPTTPAGKPKPQAQRNFTDPDSRIMVRDGAFVQAYNAQAAVDASSQVIVAEAVTNQAPDQQHLEPMLERTVNNTGAPPAQLTADNGYFSQENVEYCERRGIDPHISVGRKATAPSTSSPSTASGTVRERMAAKLSVEPGRSLYAQRKCVPEPVFGQIKTAQGFRRFSLRGLEKVRSEWRLVCACHNLRKLYRALAGKMTNLSAPTPAALPA